MKYFVWIVLILVLFFRFISVSNRYKDGDKIRVNTKVLEEPVQYDSKVRIQVRDLSVYLERFPEIRYGDNIIIEGVIEGRLIKEPKLISVNSKRGFLFELRDRIISMYYSSLPEPHSSMVAGIVLGSKGSIPIDFWETLKKSGTAHVVVASGMNVTLVASFMINLLVGFINRKKAIIFSIIIIWLYVVFSGFDAPLIRAAIMGSIAFSAVALGRLSAALNALFISAFLMLLINPFWLWDLGFILSFVATLSLILFEKLVYKKISFVPQLIREDLSTSLAAQIGVAPILLLSFGQFNLFSPLINSVVLWTVPLIMIIGMVGGLVGLLIEPLGKLIIMTIYPLTSWFILVVETAGR